MWKKRNNYQTLDEYTMAYLGLTIEQLLVPKCYEIKDMDLAAARIWKAAKQKEIVRVIGDYDCDGITATCILAWLMCILQIPYSVTIPRRITDGYGVSAAIIERLEHTDLLLTVDNGIKAFDAITAAKKKGMEVMVLDHHTAEKDQEGNLLLPEADILIDPKALPDGNGYTDYCGAGLAYKLACNVLGAQHPALPLLSAYAAIGTIGDAVPLTGDNRAIVQAGMRSMQRGQCSRGIQSLLEQCKIHEGSSAVDIAFHMVPCINAPGRLLDDGSRLALQTIFSNQAEDAGLVDELISLNKQRKELVQDALEKDLQGIKECNDHCIFYQTDAPEGIMGILAGQIVQETGKPAFAMTRTQEGVWKGSARSQSDQYSLIGLLEKHKGLFTKFGGHAKAAGFSVREENIQALKKSLEQEIPLEQKEDTTYYDLDADPNQFPSMARQILSLEPYGEGFPQPVVRVKARLNRTLGDGFQYLGAGKEHIKFLFHGFEAIGFHMASRYTDLTREFIDMIGVVSLNIWNGQKKIQLRLIDFESF